MTLIARGCIRLGKKSCCLGLVRVVQSCFEHAELRRRPEPHLAAASIQGFVARVPQRKPPVMRHVLRVHDADLLLRLLHARKLYIYSSWTARR